MPHLGVFLVALLGALSLDIGNGLTITPLPDGIAVKRNLAVKIKRAEWRLTLTLDNPNPEMVTALFREVHLFQRMIEVVPGNLSRVSRKSYWLSEVKRVKETIRTLTPKRTSRAVLGIIGQISRDLFGTATESEIASLNTKIHQNRFALQQTVHFQNELLTIVNVTKMEMFENRKTLNSIINATTEIRNTITSLQKSAKWDLQALMTYNMIQEKMSLIRRHVEDIRRVIIEHDDHRHALEEGRLDEYLMPRVTLRDILQLQKVDGAEMIQPLEWYYSNCHVRPLWGDSYLGFIVHLPLVEGRTYEGFSIETFPVPIPNSTTSATLQASGLVASSTTGQVLHLQRCTGRDPIVCDPAPLRKQGSTIHTCSQSIIMREPDISNRCPVLVQTLKEGLIIQSVPNHLVLATWGESIQEQCPGQITSQTLDIGTYIIEWNGTCFLSTQLWNIAGVYVKDIRKAVNHGWEGWDNDDFKLSKLVQEVNQTLQLPRELPMPQVISLQPLPVPVDLPEMILDHYYYVILVILIVPIVIIACYVYYRYENRLSLKKSVSVKSVTSGNDIEVDEPEIAPAQSVFKFKGIELNEAEAGTSA